MSDEQAVVPVSEPSQAIQKAEDAKTQKQTGVAMGLTITDRGVQLGSVEQGVAFANACLRSNLLPKQISTPAQAFTIMMRGAELGLKPFASWSGIYLTKANRLAIMGKTALAVVRASGLLEDYNEAIEGAGDEMKAVVYYKRKGEPRGHAEEFSVADATTAGLLGKKTNARGESYDSTYDKYLKDMLRARARGRALDIGFSDVLSGMTLEGIAEDADAAEEERRGATPAEARPVPAQGDPLADRLRAGAQAAAEKFMDTRSRGAVEVDPSDAAKAATKPRSQPATGESRESRPVTQERGNTVGTDANAGEQGVTAGETASEDDVVEAEPIADDPFEGEVVPEKPRAKLADGPAHPLFCGRCGMKTNEMGGCDVCGWPGSVDLR